MTARELTVYYNSLRLKAIEHYLAESGRTVTGELNSTLDDLYESLVPDNKRTEIENQIIQYEAEQRDAFEARRRFAVFHVREKGNDCFFTSDIINSFLSAAHRYRLYDRNELGTAFESYASSITDKIGLTEQEYNDLCDAMPTDQRITAMLDFDLDEETAAVCESSDNAWWKYRLHDVSVAIYKAHRSAFGIPRRREEIFSSKLMGKEIEDHPDEAQINSMEI
ncbi:MAG: hypothetical protein VB092_07365 [Oscillospiraceae bacterium]|nr:hypothetical protein [Oscillospiraceae bacterium]